MRVLGSTVAGILARTVPIAVHAVLLGGKIGPAGTGQLPALFRRGGGCGWGWHPVHGHWSQWKGEWVPPHCVLHRYYGGLGYI